jgi:two-component system, LytTR family, response regulator
MAKVFIVEDELILLEKMKMLLDELDHEFVGHSDNADLAIEQIKKSMPEVVLLDIALPGKNNGITIAKYINDKLRIPFIFTTSFSDKETIGEAVNTKPVTYLTKPINLGDLSAAIELALASEIQDDASIDNEHTPKVFYTKIGNKLTKIELSSILWLKASIVNYCDVFLEDDKSITVRGSMQKMLKQLPSENFVQVHRQYVINTDFIEHINIQDQSIQIKNQSIPLGRTYKNGFMKKIDRV